MSGVRGEGSDHEELYGCGGQRIELRGRRSEVRGQKTGILLWERLSAAILRFQRFERVKRLTAYWNLGCKIMFQCSASVFLFP